MDAKTQTFEHHYSCSIYFETFSPFGSIFTDYECFSGCFIVLKQRKAQFFKKKENCVTLIFLQK